MLRDPVGARAVNLTDSEAPSDIYQITADEVTKMLQTAMETGELFKGTTTGTVPMTDEDRDICNKWLNEYGISRGLTKKSTMIIPYGGTKLTCSDSIRDFMQKEDENRLQKDSTYVNPFDAQGITGKIKAVKLIHHLVWKALDTVVVAARRAMKFLSDISRAVQKTYPDGAEISWTSGIGFRVIQDKPNMKPYQIHTKLNGKIVNLAHRKAVTGYDKNRMILSLPPDFVHNLDASHLAMTANLCNDFGIPAFMPVHDSFGTHAGHAETLHTLIRQAFCEMHSGNVLERFWREVIEQYPDALDKMPSLDDIKQGDFDLEEVKSSTHFFR